MGLRERAQGQAITALADIEAEFGLEILWDGKIRHCEVEMVHRMDAELAGAADRLDVTVDRVIGFLAFHSRSGYGQAVPPVIRFNPP